MLSINNLHAAYGKVEVLHGISLDVPKGKLVTLIGSNGAGKTTTMRAISGMLKPDPVPSLWAARTSRASIPTASRAPAWPIRRKGGACSPRCR